MAEPAERPAGQLAEPLSRALAAFGRHLAAERNTSPHTVRAYLGDVSALLEHATRAGVTGPDGLSISVLRGWLAAQHRAGLARTTLARRAAAARTFTAFAHTRGLLATDPGPLLGTPRIRRRLPEVARADQLAAVLDTTVARAAAAAEPHRLAAGGPAAGATGAPHPTATGAPHPTATGAPHPTAAAELDPWERAVLLRDAAIMELLYAAGIRVSELCGLDVGDLDNSRRTIRVLGKGGKERTVPVGLPAERAVLNWARAGRCWSPRPATTRCSSVPAGGGSTRGPRAGWCTPGWPRCRPCRTAGRTACATRPPPTCWKAARTCAPFRRSSATPRWPARRSTPTCPSPGCTPRSTRLTLAPETGIE